MHAADAGRIALQRDHNPIWEAIIAAGAVGGQEVELSGNPDINGILWGYRWASTNLTYSFPTGTGEYTGYEAITGFAAFNAAQQAAMNAIIANYNGVSGLNITPGGAGANLRFAEAATIDYSTNSGLAAHNPGSPNNSAEGNPPDPTGGFNYTFGDAWFNSTSYNTPSLGTYAYAAGLMHELGHALGLAHGHATQTITHTGHTDTKPMLPADHDSYEYSVMTYRQYVGEVNPNDGDNAPNHPTSLMQDDIAALQYLYGADYGYRSGDSVYSWSPTTGEMSINGVGQGPPDPDANPATPANYILLTIWDGNGVDTYDFSNYTTNLAVDLNPGAWTTISPAQLANLGSGHFARGNIANALLFQGNFGSAIENATGGTGHDTITGNALDNTLSGGAGNDTLVGNDGFDRFEGGTGSDALAGGTGTDTAQYTFATSGVTVDLLFYPLNTGEAAGDTFDSIENLRGSNFNDILRGDDGDNAIGGWFGGGNDTLVGRGGNDSLAGGDGNDLLLGDTGGDVLDGGDGSDRASYASANSRVVADLVYEFRFSNVGDAFGDTYISVEDLIGSAFNDDLRGNEFANVLSGGGGDDVFNGRGGSDTLIGGGGNDMFFLEDLAYAGQFAGFQYDSVTEGAGAGIDAVIVMALDNPDTFSSIETYTLGANVDSGLITGDIEFNLTGNALNNYLHGNLAFNVLTGGVGDDTYVLTDLAQRQSDLFALFRYDTVTEGADAGIDTVLVTAIDNPDTFATIETYTLGANVEYGTIMGTLAFNLTGNALNNRLQGNAAFNVLTGGAGDDTYVLADLSQSQSGQFFLYLYDTVTEGEGAGIDTVLVTAIDNPDTFSSIETYTLGANIENGTIVGTLAFNLNGNTLNNRLQGDSAFNVLTGGAGDDTYVLTDLSQSQSDSFALYRYDTVTEGEGAGIDTVLVTTIDNPDTFSSIETYTLGANIENGTIVGTLAFNLTGNAVSNVISGNAGNNTLNGLGGADTLIGGVGNDILNGGAGNDILNGGAGNDILIGSTGIDWASYASAAAGVTVKLNLTTIQATGGAGSDTLTGIEYLQGSSHIDVLSGNALANTLRGLGGADTLNGGGGNDILIGDAGKDTLTGGAGNDKFKFQAVTDSAVGINRDVIIDFVHGADKIDLSAIDAKTAAGLPNDAFTFVGGFTAAGQVKFAGGILYGNTDANFATSEFEIALTGGIAMLVASDFVL